MTKCGAPLNKVLLLLSIVRALVEALQAKIPGLVSDTAPQFARFPPTFVTSVGAQYRQQCQEAGRVLDVGHCDPFPLQLAVYERHCSRKAQ